MRVDQAGHQRRAHAVDHGLPAAVFDMLLPSRRMVRIICLMRLPWMTTSPV